MTAARRHLTLFVAVIALAVGVFAPAASASASSSATKKAKQAAAARKLKSIQASDDQLMAAIKTLDDDVAAGDASAQAGQQSVKAAQAAADAAQARVNAAQAAMTKLRSALVRRAVAEYTRPDDFVTTGASSAADVVAISRRQALLDQVTNVDNDVLDQLRATRDDLQRQEAAADKAHAIAAARQKVVQAQLAQLLADRAAKGRLDAALNARIRAVQAEAAALAGDDRNIRNLLSTSGSKAIGPVGKSSSFGLIWPLKGRLTSPFGYRWGKLHAGIDIAAPKGTPIHAAKAGTVVFAGVMNGYGNVVIIDHGGGLSTLYGHQSRLGSRRGERVAQGQVIGYVGSTGHSTGNHCHFETRINGKPQNPRKYLP